MKNIRYIDKKDVENLIENKTSDDVIIFLSGPTSQKTPLSVLRTKDIIAVNGSVQYLLSHNIVPFIYVLTDVRFLHQRRDDFYKFSQRSLVLRSFYRREKGGFIKKIKFNILSQIHKELLISVPLSKKGRLVGFCKDISFGYCSCHTIAFAAIQIAYSLKYARIICSGLDLTGNCSRFYDENNNPMPSELSKDLFKILPFFRFMRDNVEDINIYNLSDDTAISYDVIPFIKFQDISREESKDKTRKKMQYRTSTDSYAN
ncbi:TPA: 3-deoxy-D-manno-oct-2-ulosonate III transferase WaaZ [Escherichia coli]|nr:3-deoxy-D-manno-oct-2-ulosonate III transferase WaaZ [Escherichia coli]